MEGGSKEDIKGVKTGVCLPWSDSFVTTVSNSSVTDVSSLRYEIRGFVIIGMVVVEVL